MATDSRTRILERLKAQRIELSPAPVIPVRAFDWDAAETADRFQHMLESVRAEVHRVGDDWPRSLARALKVRRARNLRYGPEGPLGAELAAGWPTDGPQLLAQTQPIETLRDDLFDATDAGFTSCLAGIAETGSLVLWPSPAEPRLLSLVPPIHCVLIETHQIMSTLHALIAAKSWADAMPTNALLISGPSKSADIEQTLAYGVHGPKSLIVLLRHSPGTAESVHESY